MEKWRLIKSIETNGPMQMAIDEAVMTTRIKNLVPNTLRFFTWKPPCLSIGYFQSLEQEVDAEKAKEMGVDIVRRYSGGGAVFHDRELTYSMAVSEKNIPNDIIESYKTVCNALTVGLKTVGIAGEFKPINDIIVNGKKISGNAQTRKGGIVLQHGTILMDVDLKKMFSLLKVPNEKIKDRMIESAEKRVTSIRKELGREMELEKLSNAIVSGFEKTFGICFEESGMTDYESKLAKKLCDEKYSTEEWRGLR